MIDEELRELAATVTANWQPLDTCPLERRVMLWWVGGTKLPKAPPGVAIGLLSAFEDDKVWSCGQYFSKSFYTHWSPLPGGPL